MTEVPRDLFVQGREEGWYLMPRPEGTPCLIVSSQCVERCRGRTRPLR